MYVAGVMVGTMVLPKLACNLSLNSLGLSPSTCSLLCPLTGQQKLDLWVSEQLFLLQASLGPEGTLSLLNLCRSFLFLTPTLLHWLRHTPRTLKTPPETPLCIHLIPCTSPGNGALHQDRTSSCSTAPQGTQRMLSKSQALRIYHVLRVTTISSQTMQHVINFGSKLYLTSRGLCDYFGLSKTLRVWECSS